MIINYAIVGIKQVYFLPRRKIRLHDEGTPLLIFNLTNAFMECKAGLQNTILSCDQMQRKADGERPWTFAAYYESSRC